MRFSVPLKLVDAAMTTGVMEMSALFASVASGVQGAAGRFRPDRLRLRLIHRAGAA